MESSSCRCAQTLRPERCSVPQSAHRKPSMANIRADLGHTWARGPSKRRLPAQANMLSNVDTERVVAIASKDIHHAHRLTHPASRANAWLGFSESRPTRKWRSRPPQTPWKRLCDFAVRPMNPRRLWPSGRAAACSARSLALKTIPRILREVDVWDSVPSEFDLSAACEREAIDQLLPVCNIPSEMNSSVQHAGDQNILPERDVCRHEMVRSAMGPVRDYRWQERHSQGGAHVIAAEGLPRRESDLCAVYNTCVWGAVSSVVRLGGSTSLCINPKQPRRRRRVARYLCITVPCQLMPRATPDRGRPKKELEGPHGRRKRKRGGRLFERPCAPTLHMKCGPPTRPLRTWRRPQARHSHSDASLFPRTAMCILGRPPDPPQEEVQAPVTERAPARAGTERTSL